MADAPTRTVERALSLLAAVCDQRGANLADCARDCDLPPSTALRILRRRARLVISSKVPDGGGSGRTCWFSQRSSGSSSLSAGIGPPQAAALAAAHEQTPGTTG